MRLGRFRIRQQSRTYFDLVERANYGFHRGGVDLALAQA